jgi:hypothetical protein
MIRRATPLVATPPVIELSYHAADAAAAATR